MSNTKHSQYLPNMTLGGPANNQVTFCHPCSVLAKRAALAGNDAQGVYPCITWEIQVYQGFPVSVPVCQEHLAVEQKSALIT